MTGSISTAAQQSQRPSCKRTAGKVARTARSTQRQVVNTALPLYVGELSVGLSYSQLNANYNTAESHLTIYLDHEKLINRLLSLYGCTALWILISFLIHIQSVGLLGRGISPSQGWYLHTEQHKHTINAHRHSWLECDSNSRSKCSSGRRRFMP
jgi:hypothetical protein